MTNITNRIGIVNGVGEVVCVGRILNGVECDLGG